MSRALLAAGMAAHLALLGCQRDEPTSELDAGELDGRAHLPVPEKDGGGRGDSGRAEPAVSLDSAASAARPAEPQPEVLAQSPLERNIDADPEVDVRLRRPGAPPLPTPPLERDIDADPELDLELRGPARRPATQPATPGPPWAAAAGPDFPPPQSRARDAENAFDCYRLAESSLALTETEARELCEGSRGPGPALCVRAAIEQTLLPNYRVLELCRCATSAAPVLCYERARSMIELTELERVRLCSPAANLPIGPAGLPYCGP